jgi:hypothetical protein
MDMGRVTLADYVIGTWCEAHGSQLSPKTWMHYRQLLNKHILPSLGPLELRAIGPDTIARWQGRSGSPQAMAARPPSGGAIRSAFGHEPVLIRTASKTCFGWRVA